MAQVLILNFDGADGATTYTEEAQGLSPEENTRSEIDAAWAKFGAGSLLQVSASAVELADLEYGLPAVSSAAVTLHGWIRMPALPSEYAYVALGVSCEDASPAVFIGESGAGVLAVSSGSGMPTYVPLSTSFAADTDYHIAMVIDGRDVYVFVDGSLDETHDLGEDNALGDVIGFGAMASGASWWIDAVELATGEARWTTGFTPPASAPSLVSVGFPVGATGVIVLTGYAPSGNVVNIPCAEVSLTGYAPDRVLLLDGAAEITLTGYAPDFGPDFADIPLAVSDLVGYAPSPVWTVPAVMVPTARTVYTLTVTGAADGTDDVEIPMASFQARMRDGDPSYLAAVVPDSATYEPYVTARSNGDLEIRKGVEWPDGTRQMEIIARAGFEHLYLDRGARNDSMTIVGYRTESATSPKERAVSGVSYYALQANGKRRLRCELDLFLRVGDTCIFGTGEADSLVVGAIQYTVQAVPAMAVMEVTEA